MYSFLKPSVLPDPVPANLPLIPRIIWQTCKDKNKIPPQLFECVEKLRAMNPSWEHRFFDDQSQLVALQKVCSDRFLKAYERIEPKYGAARADLFRYVMVFLHGGAYMDLKSGTTRPLDEILRPDDAFIISQWDNGPDGMFPGIGTRKPLEDIPGGEYEQWFVIAQPGHPFLAAVIEQVLDNVDRYNPFTSGYAGERVLNVTGPNAYTRVIWKLEHDYPNRRICAWPEGLRYTMLEALDTHQALVKGHYSNLSLPFLTNSGLTGWARLRYEGLEILFWMASKIRQMNYWRLTRRRAKKATDA